MICYALLNHNVYTLHHHVFYLFEPQLDQSFRRSWLNNASEGHILPLARYHAVDLLLLIELKLINPFEAFLEMFLHS